MRPLAAVVSVLAAATGGAVLLAQVLLTPPRQDLVDLGIYLVVTGIVTVAAGWFLIRFVDHRFGLALLTRFALVALVGSAVLVANIVVLAQLMFISTDHDLQVLLAAVLFSSVLAVSFTTWVASQTLSRLGAVNADIRELAAGNLSIKGDISGRDEVAALARDVRALARRLTEADEERKVLDAERRELTAAISHDLRTPLSTIRAMVDALEDGVVSEPVEMKRYFVTIRRDVDRLNRMIDDLFDLAQIDAGAMRLRRQQVSLDEIVAEVIDSMRIRAEREGISVSLSIEDRLPASMLDADRLERAIANLLRNALEHTPAGGAVHVNLRPSNGHAVLEVVDSGAGIDEADLPHIWTRFYRGERSRQRADSESDGVGLGLAITKGIVELHGGSVAVRSKVGEGSSFQVLLPLGTT